MEVFSRIRWANLGRALAVIAAVGIVVALGPGLLERPKPPPLAANIGLTGAAKPPKSGGGAAFVPHTGTNGAQGRRHGPKPRKHHEPSPPHRPHPGRRHHHHHAAAPPPPTPTPTPPPPSPTSPAPAPPPAP